MTSDTPQSVTREVISAVADAKNAEVTELEYSVAEYIDGDAIELLTRHDASTWTLSFELPDQTVVITSDDEITVETIPQSDAHPHKSDTSLEILGHCPHCGEAFKRDTEIGDRSGYSLLGKGDELALIRCGDCETEFPVPEA